MEKLRKQLDIIKTMPDKVTPERREQYKQRLYATTVSRIIREHYSQNEVEAIFANYLAHPENEQYKNEFDIFESFRESVKAAVREEINK